MKRASKRVSIALILVAILIAPISYFVTNARRSRLGHDLIAAVIAGDNTRAIRALDAGADANWRDVNDTRSAWVRFLDSLHLRAGGGDSKISYGPAAITIAFDRLSVTTVGGPLQHTNDSKMAQLVSSLTRSGANIEVKDSRGRTPIIAAAKLRLDETAKTLIGAHASLDVSDAGGRTPLYYADAELTGVLLGQLTRRRVTADHWAAMPLYMAARTGDLRKSEILLRNGADPDASPGSGLQSAVEIAVETMPLNDAISFLHRSKRIRTAAFDLTLDSAFNHHTEVIKYLLSKGELKSTARTATEALFVASRGNNLDMVRLLLNMGADVRDRDLNLYRSPLLDTYYPKGNTALHYAAESGSISVIALLLKRGSDINAQNEDQQTALNLASTGGRRDVVNLLRIHGAKP